MVDHVYSDFVRGIQDSLKQGDTTNALEAFRDTKNISEIQSNSWDLIPIICAFFTSDNETQDFELFKTCQQLIDIISEVSNADEALLQFIEEIEECSDDVKFRTLLKPLREIVHRIPKKRVNSLAWSLNAIQTYINKCKIPEDVNLVGKEKLLLDSNEENRRITKLYSSILSFYDSFIEKIDADGEEPGERHKIMCKFLVQLLGKPLAFLDMEIFEGIKSKARILAENLVLKVFKVTSDPFTILELQFNSESSELVKPNTLGTAVLFYLVYSQEVCIDLVPKIYSPIYKFQSCLHLATVLLETNHQICSEKGLALANVLLQCLNPLRLPYLLLDSEDHCMFCKALANVTIYSEMESIRKFGLSVYALYLQSFETRGFYLLVYQLVSTLNHSGLTGFTITKYKDRLVEEFLKNEQNMSVYFRGPKLLRLLRIFCNLPENEETDLIENSDRIMATLNLLRYLALRDKTNVTGIWNSFNVLEEIYLIPLRKGIDLSRAHYELKVKELQEELISYNGDKSSSKTSVTVSKQKLLEMPKNEKLKVLYSSLTAFDIMESLLSRLVECIEAHEC